MFTCPVCFYGKMPDAPADYNICPCCGTEFGADDELLTHGQLREAWMANGSRWFFHQQPPFWNPWHQLATAGVTLPYAMLVSSALVSALTQTSVRQDVNTSVSAGAAEVSYSTFAKAA